MERERERDRKISLSNLIIHMIFTMKKTGNPASKKVIIMTPISLWCNDKCFGFQPCTEFIMSFYPISFKCFYLYEAVLERSVSVFSHFFINERISKLRHLSSYLVFFS